MAATGPDAFRESAGLELARVLREAGLEAALIGGQAVNVWVKPRITQDFDFTVAADRAAIERAEALLQDDGFRHLRRQDAGEPSGPDFVRMKRDEPFVMVDLQPAKTPYQEGLIRRAVPVAGGVVDIATPEDLIITKLIANRSKDHGDLLELLVLPQLDWRYIEEWAAFWQVTDRLEEVREFLSRPRQTGPP